MRAIFWNERDTFDLSLIAPLSTFKKNEKLFKKVVESISFFDLDKDFSKSYIKAQFLPLPKKYSEIVSGKRNVHIETLKNEDLPPNFRRLRHIWKDKKLTEKGIMEEELWVEYLIQGNEVFYIKRKVDSSPIPHIPFGFDPSITEAAIITFILEEAIGQDKLIDKEKFKRWLITATTAYYRGLSIDTKFEENGFYISLKRKDDDLILEIARSETIRALYKKELGNGKCELI